MRAFVRRTDRLTGTLRVPGDKSISHRAVLFGALARGLTRVDGLAPGGDVRSSMACVERLGVRITKTGDTSFDLDSPGRAGWNRGDVDLDAGNSGTTTRLLLGMLAPVTGLTARITGDASLSRRPMKRVQSPLLRMGAAIELTPSGALPGLISGRSLHGADLVLDVASAQVKTAVLLAGLDADGRTSVTEPEQSRDHTERLLPAFGGTLQRSGTTCTVERQSLVAPHDRLLVPGDPSSAAFFAVAASIVPGADVLVQDVATNPTRTASFEVLKAMGASVALEDAREFAEPVGSFRFRHGALTGTTIAGAIVPSLIDEVPILAIAAALAHGRTIIRDAKELRVKESDRLALVAKGLRSMGVSVEELPDGLVIDGGRPLHGAHIETDMDHRIVMAFTVAGLVADGETVVEGAEWAGISFPSFFDDLARLTGGAVRTGA